MNKQINITNCKNCGAPLHYDIKKRNATCDYCKTEYHLDNLGRIEEYKIEIEIYGKRRKFYIGQINVEPIFTDVTRLCDGTLQHIASEPIIKLELISY